MPDPNEPTPEMVETKQLEEKLQAIQDQMNKSAQDRHRVNGILHSTLNSVAMKTAAQDTVLDDIHKAVARIETCLLGDAQYQRIGLIAELTAEKASRVILEKRVSDVEDAVRSRTRAAIVAASVISGLGAAIAWVKGSGLVSWLSK